MGERIKLGISTCLLGENVRYDGGHKLDRFLTDTLGAYVDYVPVCPETDCGLGIPREAMRLVGDPGSPRLLTIKTKKDHTDSTKSKIIISSGLFSRANPPAAVWKGSKSITKGECL
jgi:uncharacterized protein YbbK (DUF523 family)